MTEHVHELHVINGSHPCVAVEHALRSKGQDWRRREVIPPMQAIVMRRRFGSTTVPAIRFADGERIQGSMAIMRALDARWPEPALYPDDAHREERELAERWGDDDLQMTTRRLLFAGIRRRPTALASYAAGGPLPLPRPLAAVVAPLICAGERRLHSMTQQQVDRDIEQLPATFDRIDDWIARGVLGGEHATGADLQVFSSVRLLLTMQDIADRFGHRPAAHAAMRLFPTWSGTLPAGTLWDAAEGSGTQATPTAG